MGTRKKECSSLVSDVLRICSHRNWLLRKMQMSGESAVLNRFLMWALLYWNENVHILSWAVSPVDELKWAPPGASAGPQFLDKLIMFSGWLIFITNALDEINTNTWEEQTTLHRPQQIKPCPDRAQLLVRFIPAAQEGLSLPLCCSLPLHPPHSARAEVCVQTWVRALFVQRCLQKGGQEQVSLDRGNLSGFSWSDSLSPAIHEVPQSAMSYKTHQQKFLSFQTL